MTSIAIDLPMDEIRDFCARWKIREFALFGSVLRDDFRPDSDIDVLVSFEPDAKWSLLDHVRMEDDLAAIVGRDVDIVGKDAVEQSRNRFRRHEILGTAHVIFAA